jgi:hypothetical protein
MVHAGTRGSKGKTFCGGRGDLREPQATVFGGRGDFGKSPGTIIGGRGGVPAVSVSKALQLRLFRDRRNLLYPHDLKAFVSNFVSFHGEPLV